MRGFLLTWILLMLIPLALARPFAGILVYSWLSFMNPHQISFGMTIDLPWVMLAFIATLIGCLVAKEPKRIPVNSTTILFTVFLFCITLTSATAMGPDALVWDKWTTVAKTLFAMLLTACLLDSRRRIHAMIWLVAISIGYFGIKGGAFAIMTGGSARVYGPPMTVISDNNHVAAAILVCLPFMNYLRVQSRHRLLRIAWTGGMALSTLATVASYSRGALIGLAAVSVLLWLQSRKKIVSAIGIAIVAFSVFSFMPATWLNRMNTIETYNEDGSAQTRLVMWDTSWKLAVSHPLTGSGFMGPYSRNVVDTVSPGAPARAVHSIWFEMLGEHGFPTFLVWFALSVVGFLNGRSLVKMTQGRPRLKWGYDLGRMAQISVVAYLTTGTFLSLDYWDAYFCLLVIIASARQLISEELASTEPDWAQTKRRSLRPSFAPAQGVPQNG